MIKAPDPIKMNKLINMSIYEQVDRVDHLLKLFKLITLKGSEEMINYSRCEMEETKVWAIWRLLPIEWI